MELSHLLSKFSEHIHQAHMGICKHSHINYYVAVL